jgi:hypothetical protein
MYHNMLGHVFGWGSVECHMWMTNWLEVLLQHVIRILQALGTDLPYQPYDFHLVERYLGTGSPVLTSTLTLPWAFIFSNSYTFRFQDLSSHPTYATRLTYVWVQDPDSNFTSTAVPRMSYSTNQYKTTAPYKTCMSHKSLGYVRKYTKCKQYMEQLL